MRRSLFALAGALALSAAASAQPATVVLVRHAERAPEPASDPVLSAAGIQRADALKQVLAGAGVTHVVTTHLQRTRLTAKPVSDALGAEPTIVRVAMPVTKHVEDVAAAVRALPAGSVVLVVGHSNTIPHIVTALGGPAMKDLCETQYANLYVLNFAAGRGTPSLIHAKYGAADPPEGESCPRM